MTDDRDARGPLAALLEGLAGLYGVAMGSRARLFRSGRLPSHRLPCKVVSVGNITVGGTGKTPMCLYMARLIRRTGRRVAVVSRGYKGQAEQQGGIVSDGQSLRMSSAAAGDEPYLMARQLLPLGIPVLVGHNRVRSGALAVKRFRTDVIVLDDGFQHQRLQRDLDLVLLDAGRPFGNGYLLPRGTLREPLSALARADACLLTRCPRAVVEEARRPPADRNLRRPVFPVSQTPQIAEWVPAGAMDRGHLRPGLGKAPAGPVYAFSGIARNSDFYANLRDLGFDLRGRTPLPDHHTYTRGDLAVIETRADRAGARMLVTTEKDRVKIDESWLERFPLLVMGVQMDFGRSTEAFQRFVCRKLGL
jgi:tetraacyldisaccharide 4'-kinase